MEIEDYPGYMVSGMHKIRYSNLVIIGFPPIGVGFDHLDQISQTFIERVFALVAGKVPTAVSNNSPAILVDKISAVVVDRALASIVGMVLVATKG